MIVITYIHTIVEESERLTYECSISDLLVILADRYNREPQR